MKRKRNIKCFNNVSLSDPSSPFLLYQLVEFAADEGQKKRKKTNSKMTVSCVCVCKCVWFTLYDIRQQQQPFWKFVGV